MSETNVAVKDPEEKKDEVIDVSDIDAPVGEEKKDEVIDVSDAPVEEKIKPAASRSIRILKEGDEKADGETIYTVNGDVVKDSNGNDVNDDDLKKEILAKVQSGGRRRSRRNRHNGHRQSKKRQQKRQSKKQKQNGGRRGRHSKRNQKK